MLTGDMGLGTQSILAEVKCTCCFIVSWGAGFRSQLAVLFCVFGRSFRSHRGFM